MGWLTIGLCDTRGWLAVCCAATGTAGANARRNEIVGRMLRKTVASLLFIEAPSPRVCYVEYSSNRETDPFCVVSSISLWNHQSKKGQVRFSREKLSKGVCL